MKWLCDVYEKTSFPMQLSAPFVCDYLSALINRGD